jgi:hypothetical protein
MELKSLAILIQDEVGVQGPFKEDEVLVYDENEYSISKQYAVSNTCLFNFLLDQGSFIKYIFDDMERNHDGQMNKNVIVQDFGKFVLNLIEGISEIEVVSHERYFYCSSRTRLYECACECRCQYPSCPSTSTSSTTWKRV